MARKPKQGEEQPPPNYAQPQAGYQQNAGYQQGPPDYGPPPNYQQAPGYPPPGWQPERKKRGGLATASLVLGIIGLILAVIPFANYVAYPLVILAIIFGLIAIRWGKAKAGLVLGVVGLVATIIWSVAIAGAFNDATSKPHTVVYKVTGTVPKADVSYYTSDGSGNDTNRSQDGVSLPFTKTVTVKGDFSGFILQANTPMTLNAPKGTLACTLSVDGKIVSRDSAKGSMNLVSCDGSGYDGN